MGTVTIILIVAFLIIEFVSLYIAFKRHNKAKMYDLIKDEYHSMKEQKIRANYRQRKYYKRLKDKKDEYRLQDDIRNTNI